MKKIIFLVIFLVSTNCFAIDLKGTGATFPYKFLKSAFDSYEKKNIDTKINYIPSGSKKGYESLKSQSVDFSAVDMYLKDELLKTFPYPNEIIHIPICVSGIGIAYNVKNVGTLNLSAKIISEILIRNITNWNDPEIKKLNPDKQLPNLEIIVILREGGSGSSYLLTQYLSKLNNLWKLTFGELLEIKFPGCILAKNSEQMQKLLSQVPGSFGYLAYSYKDGENFNFAAIENINGHYIKPSTKSISEAANIPLPTDTRISIIDSNSEKGYPLSSFSWIITYKNQNYNTKNLNKYTELKSLLTWIVQNGQSHTEKTGYSPLPQKAKLAAKNVIEQLYFSN